MKNQKINQFIDEFQNYFIDWYEEDVIENKNLSRAIEITQEALKKYKKQKYQEPLKILLYCLEKAKECNTCLSLELSKF